MNDKSALNDVLASNVNSEVLVFRGATTGELMVVAAISTAIVVPCSLLLGLATGKVPLFVSLSLPVVFASIYVCSSLLLSIKRGRPDGYFEHRFLLVLQRARLRPSSLVAEHGAMSPFRTKQIVVIDSRVEHDDV